jgi:hypothetical protein
MCLHPVLQIDIMHESNGEKNCGASESILRMVGETLVESFPDFPEVRHPGSNLIQIISPSHPNEPLSSAKK